MDVEDSLIPNLERVQKKNLKYGFQRVVNWLGGNLLPSLERICLKMQ